MLHPYNPIFESGPTFGPAAKRRRRPRAGLAATALALMLTGTSLLPSRAAATPVLVDPFEQLYHVGANSLGFSTGDFVRYGANVSLNGTNLAAIQSSVTASASTILIAGANAGQTLTRPVAYNGSPSSGAFYSGLTFDSASVRGSWTLSFSDGIGAPATTATPAIPVGAQQTPFAQNITLSGTGNNPNFTWTPPAGTPVNGYRINIFDSAQVSATNPSGQILSRNFGAATNSFAVTNSSPGLQPGYVFNQTSKYSIEISMLQTRDGSGTNLSNNNIYAMSRVYADFKITNSGDIQVNLPVAKVDGAYVFNMAVQPGVTYYIDPDVATGYRYETGAGNPNFASILLPNLQAALYHLAYQYNGSDFDFQLAGGVQYFLPAGGVNAFTVSGIDASLGLDPNNPVAFITGLTFVGPGQFTGTMTPITTFVSVPVPEPASMALFLTGALGLWQVKRRGTMRGRG